MRFLEGASGMSDVQVDRPGQTGWGKVQQSTAAVLARIAARDADVRAWTYVDLSVLDDAARLDSQSTQGQDRTQGLLHGVAVAVKDVIDVAGMPTRHNSLLSDARPLLSDAPCVATLRAAGAVIVGKTDTTEFAAAGRDAATGNPHALHRTPGGSSSGSAAAVADGHVPVALATQTGGSTIRPASFCGIHALKPTWGAISREGAKLYANSLDTIGLYACDLAHLDTLCNVYGFAPPAPRQPGGRLRIGVCRTPYWDRAEPETREAMADAELRLAASGAEMVPITLVGVFERLDEAFRAVLFREGRAAFLNLQRMYPELLHADFHERVDSMAQYPDEALIAAYDDSASARKELESMLNGLDALLTPSAPGIAPAGRGPGNPIFNQMWTLLHVPVVNLPLYRAQENMPLGLSLVGRRFNDRGLLAVAGEIERRLGLHRILHPDRRP